MKKILISLMVLMTLCFLSFAVLSACGKNDGSSTDTPASETDTDSHSSAGDESDKDTESDEPNLNLFSLNVYDVEIQVDGSYLIVASIGNENVTWESSALEVVTVENGLIKGKSVGTANIYVKNTDDEAVCRVVVVEKKNEVATLKVNTDNTSLFLGKEFDLGAHFTYQGGEVDGSLYNLTYASEDETVATVSANGVLTGVGEGKTVIIVSGIYGGLYYEERIEVTISNPLNFFDLTKSKYALAFGKTVSGKDNTLMTSAEIEFDVYVNDVKQDKSTLEVQYISKNENVVTVSDGVMTAKGIGSTSVEIVYEGSKTEINVVVGTPISEVADLTELSYAFKNATNKEVAPTLWSSDKIYVLTNDIDFNGKSFLGIATVYRAKDGDGYWWQTNHEELNSPKQFAFSGTIDGAGHKILNMNLMPVWSQWSNYFFKGANFIGHLGGTLENIAFINTTTYGAGSTPITEAGLIGYLRQNARLDNVYFNAMFNCGRFAGNGSALASWWNYDFGQGDTVSVNNCIVNVKYNDAWQSVTTYGQTTTKEGAFIESPNVGGAVTDINNCYVISPNMTETELYGSETYISRVYKNFTELLSVKSIEKLKDDGFNDFIIDIVSANLYELDIDQKSLTLVHGKTVGGDDNSLMTATQLGFTLYYNGEEQSKTGANISFSTSDESVFTVSSNGLVTATGLGKAVLTATYQGAIVSVPVVVGTPISSINDMNVLAIAYAKGNYETLWAKTAYYVLTNDIDYTSQGRLLAIAPVAAHADARYTEWYKNGISGYLFNSTRDNATCAQFYGTIDGAGHKIMNAKLYPTAYAWGDTWNTGMNNAGFWQGTNFIGHLAGTVKNLAFTNLTYQGSNKAVQFAGLFGYLRPGANVENLYIDIKVSVGAFNVGSGVFASMWNYDDGLGDTISVKNVIIKAELDSEITDWTQMGYSNLATTKLSAFMPDANGGKSAKISDVYVISKTYTADDLGVASSYLGDTVYTSSSLFSIAFNKAYLKNKGFSDEIINLI